jgi:hypothetical protein
MTIDEVNNGARIRCNYDTNTATKVIEVSTYLVDRHATRAAQKRANPWRVRPDFVHVGITLELSGAYQCRVG